MTPQAEAQDSLESAEIHVDGKVLSLPVTRGTEDEAAVDISQLRKERCREHHEKASCRGKRSQATRFTLLAAPPASLECTLIGQRVLREIEELFIPGTWFWVGACVCLSVALQMELPVGVC